MLAIMHDLLQIVNYATCLLFYNSSIFLINKKYTRTIGTYAKNSLPNRQADGQADGLTDGRTNTPKNEHTGKQMHRQMNIGGQANGRIVEQINRQIIEQITGTNISIYSTKYVDMFFPPRAPI